MVSRKYNPRKRKKIKQPRALWANLVLLAGLAIAIVGFLLSYIICVDRIAEFLYNGGHHNNWEPIQGEPLEIILTIPALLYITVMKFMEASFATLIFFPLVIVVVPLTDIFFYWDFTLFLYGFAPLCVGIGIVLFSIVAGEDHSKLSDR